MWTVVYLSQERDSIDSLVEELGKKEIKAKIRPVNKESKTAGEYFEVLVTEEDIDTTHSIIIESGY